MDNTKCFICGASPLSKDEIGLTKKLIDKDAVRFRCLGCMAKALEATKEELLTKAEEFREKDCIFFR